MTDWAAHYEQRAAEAEEDARADYYERPRRTPLRTNQHILHLLLTVFTCGLWAPVWIIRAIQGNQVPPDPSAPIPEWPPQGKTA